MVAGPFWGEFGWELMRWQGYLRMLSKTNTVQVKCQIGHEYLYSDFAADIVLCARLEDTPAPDKWRPSEEESYLVMPSKKICEDPKLPQKFIKYGNPYGQVSYDVLIHARKKAPFSRNWPDLSWDIFADHLDGLKVAYIGSKDGARRRMHGEDLRGIPLESLCNAMAASKVLVGPSSGPHHLAALCGLPSLVWTDKRKWNVGGVRTTNWNRYHKHWNPLNTKVAVIDTEDWQPSVEQVERALEKNKFL